MATAALSLALAALGSSPVAAQTSGVCAGEIVIDEYGTITCLATTPGSGGGTDPVDDGGDGGNSSGGNSGNGGVDDGAGRVELVIGLTGQTCTPIGLTDPQPPKNDAVWEGNDDGAIFDCVINAGAADSADVGEVIQMHAAADTPLAPPRQILPFLLSKRWIRWGFNRLRSASFLNLVKALWHGWVAAVDVGVRSWPGDDGTEHG
ncbi:hypothetical protein [Ornithinimicrobium sp. INDO-MA30-4]|uniref:hypothetical protein n=1 Tax=Ornithinimicrobium sp. INDO-MA30-4 TaxID=2908651 RepID=UPI001F3D87EC|nr:hypothetical protein [Ornithinimicrobium sp. INDO-MA30-4]UJH71780.1 hypothetical protein L0A91_16990 [Ornithinimicrobium sp. INDO-MA30-4]